MEHKNKIREKDEKEEKWWKGRQEKEEESLDKFAKSVSHDLMTKTVCDFSFWVKGSQMCEFVIRTKNRNSKEDLISNLGLMLRTMTILRYMF